MKKYGFWYCLRWTIDLSTNYHFLRFEKSKAYYKGYRFEVEVADNIPKRRMGLSFRNGIRTGRGMLLAYVKNKSHLIWMMNMKFAIDILWLDEDGIIRTIVKDAPPAESLARFAMYEPKGRSKYVLELAAGSVNRYGIRLGNRFTLPNATPE